jgi:hypothetical protein
MTRHLITLMLVLCLPLTAFGRSPVDALLKQVPDDAALVIVVPSFHELEAGVIAFGKAAEIKDLAKLKPGDMMDEMLDGNVEGLDPRGAFLAVMKPGESRPLLLGTLSDPDAWQAGAEAEEIKPGVMRVDMHDETWFVGRVGKVGIIAPDEATLQTAMKPAGKFPEHFASGGAAMLKDHAVVLWADVARWRPLIEPSLMVARGFMQMGMVASDPEAEGAVALYDWMFEKLHLLVEGSRTWAAGLRIDGKGIFAQDILTLDPEGEAAGWLRKLSAVSADPLRGLAGEPGMLVLAAEWKAPAGMESPSEGMLNAMLGTPKGQALLEDEKVNAGFEAARETYDLMTGYNMSMSKAPGRGIRIAGLYLSDEPDQLVKHMRTMSDALMSAEYLQLFTSQMSMDCTRRSERVRGQDADVFSCAFAIQGGPAEEAIRAIYGDEMTFWLTRHREGAAFAFGGGEVGPAALEALLDPGAGRLASDARVAAARKAISPGPQILSLLDVGKLVALGLTLSPNFPEPAQPACDAPLMALGIYLERTALRAEMVMPVGAVKQVMSMWEHSEDAAHTGRGHDAEHEGHGEHE